MRREKEGWVFFSFPYGARVGQVAQTTPVPSFVLPHPPPHPPPLLSPPCTVDINTVSFMFDGVRLTGQETPADVSCSEGGEGEERGREGCGDGKPKCSPHSIHTLSLPHLTPTTARHGGHGHARRFPGPGRRRVVVKMESVWGEEGGVSLFLLFCVCVGATSLSPCARAEVKTRSTNQCRHGGCWRPLHTETEKGSESARAHNATRCTLFPSIHPSIHPLSHQIEKSAPLDRISASSASASGPLMCSRSRNASRDPKSAGSSVFWRKRQ